MPEQPPFTVIKGNPPTAPAVMPGATIGILGGGQLGRMLAMAAAQLGFRCHIFAPEKDSVAAEVSARFTCAEWHDAEKLAEFAQDCAVITFEFENIPTGPLGALPPAKLRPGVRALEVAQDRLAEKRFVEELGGRAAPFAEVDSADDLAAALARIGTPGILKTRRDGYDGKGQWRIASEREAEGLALHDGGFIYEGFVRFGAEFSVIAARGPYGGMCFWDSAANVHVAGILSTSSLPAGDLVARQVPAARDLARRAMEKLDYVGVAAFEFFATESGPVFNEMAPRVHNSGHWSIEGALTSQFENHIRAVCGLPLGATDLTSELVTMRNLIGPEALDALELLADPRNHLHLYGKAEAREGRKMGHVTRLGGA